MTDREPLSPSFERKALKSLEKLAKGNRQAARRILESIDDLLRQPEPASSLKVVDFEKDGRRVRRVRVGDYRVLYSIDEEKGELIVLAIDHRKDVYRDIS